MVNLLYPLHNGAIIVRRQLLRKRPASSSRGKNKEGLRRNGLTLDYMVSRESLNERKGAEKYRMSEKALKIPPMNGKVYAVCVGKKRSVAKERVKAGFIRAGHGLDGDGHAGLGRRQISLLALERIMAVNGAHNLGAVPGDFAENITTTGIDWSAATSGSLIEVGTVKLRVVERGKPEHGLNDYSYNGVALLAKEGIFAEVIESGYVIEGDAIGVRLSDEA
jgi:MOSC domain-containing protein YiiM